MACVAVMRGVAAGQAGCIAAQIGGCGAGRSTERPVLSEEEIERNVQGIKRILEQLIASGNGAGPAPLILNNLVSQPRRCTQACNCCFQYTRMCHDAHSSQPFIAARLADPALARAAVLRAACTDT